MERARRKGQSTRSEQTRIDATVTRRSKPVFLGVFALTRPTSRQGQDARRDATTSRSVASSATRADEEEEDGSPTPSRSSDSFNPDGLVSTSTAPSSSRLLRAPRARILASNDTATVSKRSRRSPSSDTAVLPSPGAHQLAESSTVVSPQRRRDKPPRANTSRLPDPPIPRPPSIELEIPLRNSRSRTVIDGSAVTSSAKKPSSRISLEIPVYSNGHSRRHHHEEAARALPSDSIDGKGALDRRTRQAADAESQTGGETSSDADSDLDTESDSEPESAAGKEQLSTHPLSTASSTPSIESERGGDGKASFSRSDTAPSDKGKGRDLEESARPTVETLASALSLESGAVPISELESRRQTPATRKRPFRGARKGQSARRTPEKSRVRKGRAASPASSLYPDIEVELARPSVAPQSSSSPRHAPVQALTKRHVSPTRAHETGDRHPATASSTQSRDGVGSTVQSSVQELDHTKGDMEVDLDSSKEEQLSLRQHPITNETSPLSNCTDAPSLIDIPPSLTPHKEISAKAGQHPRVTTPNPTRIIDITDSSDSEATLQRYAAVKADLASRSSLSTVASQSTYTDNHNCRPTAKPPLLVSRPTAPTMSARASLESTTLLPQAPSSELSSFHEDSDSPPLRLAEDQDDDADTTGDDRWNRRSRPRRPVGTHNRSARITSNKPLLAPHGRKYRNSSRMPSNHDGKKRRHADLQKTASPARKRPRTTDPYMLSPQASGVGRSKPRTQTASSSSRGKSRWLYESFDLSSTQRPSIPPGRSDHAVSSQSSRYTRARTQGPQPDSSQCHLCECFGPKRHSLHCITCERAICEKCLLSDFFAVPAYRALVALLSMPLHLPMGTQPLAHDGLDENGQEAQHSEATSDVEGDIPLLHAFRDPRQKSGSAESIHGQSPLSSTSQFKTVLETGLLDLTFLDFQCPVCKGICKCPNCTRGPLAQKTNGSSATGSCIFPRRTAADPERYAPVPPHRRGGRPRPTSSTFRSTSSVNNFYDDETVDSDQSPDETSASNLDAPDYLESTSDDEVVVVASQRRRYIPGASASGANPAVQTVQIGGGHVPRLGSPDPTAYTIHGGTADPPFASILQNRASATSEDGTLMLPGEVSQNPRIRLATRVGQQLGKTPAMSSLEAADQPDTSSSPSPAADTEPVFTLPAPQTSESCLRCRAVINSGFDSGLADSVDTAAAAGHSRSFSTHSTTLLAAASPLSTVESGLDRYLRLDDCVSSGSPPDNSFQRHGIHAHDGLLSIVQTTATPLSVDTDDEIPPFPFAAGLLLANDDHKSDLGIKLRATSPAATDHSPTSCTLAIDTENGSSSFELFGVTF